MTRSADGSDAPEPSVWRTTPSRPSTTSSPTPTSSCQYEYEDPEEDDDWVIPPSPRAEGLVDNTKNWGPVYAWRGDVNPRQGLVSIAVTREITPPWRRGWGLTWRTGGSHGRAVGLWFKGPGPLTLSQPPAERDVLDVVQRSKELGTLPAHE